MPSFQLQTFLFQIIQYIVYLASFILVFVFCMFLVVWIQRLLLAYFAHCCFQDVLKIKLFKFNFRCLIHSDLCLAEFLGIHHIDAATPAFIYSGRLQSVSRFMNSCSNPARNYGRILNQTAIAIEYLHSKGLVHMELTKDSLTVRLSLYTFALK